MTEFRDIWLHAHNMIRTGRKIINKNLHPLDLSSAEGNILLHLLTQGQEMKDKQGAIKMLAPDKAAKIILDGVKRDRTRFVVGPDSAFMNLIYRLNPRRASHFMYKQMQSLLPE